MFRIPELKLTISQDRVLRPKLRTNLALEINQTQSNVITLSQIPEGRQGAVNSTYLLALGLLYTVQKR